MKRRPRCTMDVDVRYNHLDELEGDFLTVSLCAEKALKLAVHGLLPSPITTDPSHDDNTSEDSPSSGPYWWSYNIATNSCYLLNMTYKVEITETAGWISGSPACGVITTKGQDILCSETRTVDNHCYILYTGTLEHQGVDCSMNCIYTKVGPSSNLRYCLTSNYSLVDMDDL